MTVAKERETPLLGHVATSGVDWLNRSILVKLTLGSVTNVIFALQHMLYRDNKVRHYGTKTNPGKLGFATAELENDNVLKGGY